MLLEFSIQGNLLGPKRIPEAPDRVGSSKDCDFGPALDRSLSPSCFVCVPAPARSD